MTAVVDYGVGNLSSLVGSLRHIGENAVVTADPEKLLKGEIGTLGGVRFVETTEAKIFTADEDFSSSINSLLDNTWALEAQM